MAFVLLVIAYAGAVFTLGAFIISRHPLEKRAAK